MKFIYTSLLILCFTDCFAQSKDKKLEEELIKVKNQAFCDCYYKATKEESVKYKDGSTYIQVIDLKGEYIFGNEAYRKMVSSWAEKEYKSYDPSHNLYLMKCLDFYNSAELKEFIDVIRQNETKLKDK